MKLFCKVGISISVYWKIKCHFFAIFSLWGVLTQIHIGVQRNISPELHFNFHSGKTI